MWGGGQPGSGGDCVQLTKDATWEVVDCATKLDYTCKLKACKYRFQNWVRGGGVSG